MCLGKPFFPQGGRSEVPQAGCPGPPTPQEGRAGHFDQGEHKTNSAHQPGGEKSLLQRGSPHRVSLPAPSRSTPSSRPGGQHWWVAAAAGAPRVTLAVVTSLIPRHAWLSIPHPLATASYSRKERTSFCLTFHIAFNSSNVIA